MKKIILLMQLFLMTAVLLPSCGEDEKDEPTPPSNPDTEQTVTYAPEEIFTFREFIYGGATFDYNGHVTGTQTLVVEPFWNTDENRTIVVNLGERYTKNEYMTVGSETLTLVPLINEEKMGSGWEIKSTEFVYQGVSYGKRFDIPYEIDRDSETLKVEFKYEVVNNAKNLTVKNDIMVSVQVLRS